MNDIESRLQRAGAAWRSALGERTVVAVPVPATRRQWAPAMVAITVFAAAVSLTFLGRNFGDPATPAPPADRITATLQMPTPLQPGQRVTYTVRLDNPTTAPFPLRPCPSYLLTRKATRAGSSTPLIGDGEGSQIGCDRLPKVLLPGESATVELATRLWGRHPDLSGRLDVSFEWTMRAEEFPPPRGGDPNAPYPRTTVFSTPVDYPPPSAPVATVPWRDTPTPPGGPEAVVKLGPAPYASLHVSIDDLPAVVRRGEVVQYSVRVTNMATGGEVSLDPCPGFVQVLFAAKRRFVDEHYLNCDSAPAGIAGQQAVRFLMTMRIPADAPAGSASFAWKIGKVGLDGSESAQTTLTIE